MPSLNGILEAYSECKAWGCVGLISPLPKSSVERLRAEIKRRSRKVCCAHCGKPRNIIIIIRNAPKYSKTAFLSGFVRTKSRRVLSGLQSGVCGCERGYTEVMTTHGFLDYCTRTPGVWDSNKKADVKTGSSGGFKPGSSPAQDLFSEWTLRPIGPGT